MVLTQYGNDLQGLQPVFPEGAAWEEFEELITELDEVANVIDAEVNIGSVVNKVFLSDD